MYCGNGKAQGKTIVIAEHRLYYLMDIADRILYMQGGQIKRKPFHLRLQKEIYRRIARAGS